MYRGLVTKIIYEILQNYKDEIILLKSFNNPRNFYSLGLQKFPQGRIPTSINLDWSRKSLFDQG